MGCVNSTSVGATGPLASQRIRASVADRRNSLACGSSSSGTSGS